MKSCVSWPKATKLSRTLRPTNAVLSIVRPSFKVLAVYTVKWMTSNSLPWRIEEFY